MPIASGTRLGAYEIIAPLGAGGMGEVYRARDTRLGREVAVKVLPEHLAATPELRARFEREAHTISSLNHPNICTLYDVGHEGDTEYLVMELVEGETLADRLARGPLPTSEVLRVGTQIADALDKAHRAGIVHRDLKPGNIMLAKSGTKLLDFGLARATGLGPAAAGRADSPTMSHPLTAEGAIVGTFLYIAPEQLEGNEADARTDIWGLGCVLYEMITGIRPFQGKSRASLISAIMSADPAPMAQLSPLNPPALERLVKACLAKDPEQRIQTAHDVKLQLQWIAEGGSQAGIPAPVAARRRSRERLAWVLAAVTTVLAVVLGGIVLKPKPPAKPVMFELTPPRQVRSIDLPRISPDGHRLAFNATDSTGAAGIWVREMDSLEGRRLQGTEGATRPFWSPDSRFLAFFSGGKLYKVDTAGGPPIPLCEAPRGADGSWSARGLILFDGSTGDSIQSVPASGGVPVGATRIDRKNQETYDAWPQFLPDGRHFLYIGYGAGSEGRTLKVGSIGSLETKALGAAGSRTEYASGHLLSVRSGALLAQPFDTRALKLSGDPFPVAEGVETDAVGSARFSASTEGTLVYRAGSGGGTFRLVWTDRRGEQIGTVGGPGVYSVPALSPDGTQLAVLVGAPSRASGDIWLWDLARNVGSRFTFETQDVDCPVWSPDGSRLLYTLGRGNDSDLHVKAAGGAGVDSLLYASDEQKLAGSWSADGRWIAYMMRSSAVSRWDISALSLEGSPRSVPVTTTPFLEVNPAISPDGRWLAYQSNESGEMEVYVRTFPGPGSKWRVSTQGGREAEWRGDGRELYYVTFDGKMMAVAVEPGAPAKFSLPHELFDTPLGPPFPTRNRYVVTRDGQRFLFVSPQSEGQVEATTVVLDWLGRLRRR
jgi:serine/threonine protein kinase/Tol biopolymer transport system component